MEFTIRPATVADINVLARHRCEMFSEMGELENAFYAPLAEASAAYFARAIPSGEYVAWVVSPGSEPGRIVAGGGMQLRRILPRPGLAGGLQKTGPQGLIVNIYTDPDWRRRGLAELLLLTMLDWCRANEVSSVVLHASSMGRALYERLGFLTSNEMYYPL